MNKPECKTYPSGTKEWLLDGEFHREDGPAIEYSSGTKEWYLNGELHREDGPAVEEPDGTKYWFLNGKLHREDRPAIEHPNGTKHWYLNGNEIHPEVLVDLWLEREVFCWYDETTDTLNFAEQ
jgi:antitoxin component YwqK of YwqJK toxin-antitoxin module